MSKIGVSNDGQQGRNKLKTRIDEKADLIFSMVMKLGENNYSDSTKAAIMAEAERNEELRKLAVNYLYCSSQSAPMNLYKLHTKIVEVFFTDPATGEVRV